MENILFYFANFPVYSYGAMLGLGLLIGSCWRSRRQAQRFGQISSSTLSLEWHWPSLAPHLHRSQVHAAQ